MSFFVCVFTSFYLKCSSRLNKKINVMPEFRSAMLYRGNNSVLSTAVATSYKIIAGTLKLATIKRESIKPGKAARSKRQLFMTFSNQH